MLSRSDLSISVTSALLLLLNWVEGGVSTSSQCTSRIVPMAQNSGVNTNLERPGKILPSVQSLFIGHLDKSRSQLFGFRIRVHKSFFLEILSLTSQ